MANITRKDNELRSKLHSRWMGMKQRCNNPNNPQYPRYGGREIKFRAWTNKDKCWCGAFSVHKSGLFTEMTGARMENGTCVAYADWIDLSKQDELVLMQYTGLKDKNGKEIYEGDVVRISKDHTEVMNWVGDGDWMGDKQPLVGFVHHSAIYKRPIEIIGNIYENPELLQHDA
jgi:uncharacterized phage protein (TIGR01671 family)